MKNQIQQLRDGLDWTWWIVFSLLMVPVIAGVLENKGILNIIP